MMKFNHKKHNYQNMENNLGFFGIIRESVKTTSRNGKLLLPVLLLVFLASSQLDFAQKYILAPVAKDFVMQLAKHPNMVHDLTYNIDQNMVHDLTYNIDQTTYVGALDDVREILLVKLLILIISSIISLVFLVATVSSSSEAYTAKVLSPKDIFLKIKTSWKRPLVTSFYMILLTLGIICVYLISIGITSILAVNSCAVLFFGAITLSIPVCYFYVAALWMVSVVVSVLEDGVVGVKAIGRAAELMKGKKIQASLMMVLFTMFYGVVHMTARSVTSYNLSRNTQLAITIPFKNGMFCLLKLFMFVVYTIFYHERKTSHDQKEEGKGFYVAIAAADQA